MSFYQLILVTLPWLLTILILDKVGESSDSLLVLFLALILVPLSIVVSSISSVYFRYKNRLKKPKLSTKIYNEYSWWDPRKYF